MKITMGVDDAGRAADVADVIHALQFSTPQIDIVHVTESWGDAPYTAVKRQTSEVLTRYNEMIDGEAQGLLATVKDDLAKRPFAGVKTHHLRGFISNKLLQHAEDTGADLVAIASSGKGPIEGLMVGSVARKTAIASKRSVLVVKQPLKRATPLTVVFATDHSPYSKRCVDEFVRLAPKGIARIVVTTVYPEAIVKAMGSVVGNFKADVSGWLRTELEDANQAVCGKLKPLGAQCQSRVEAGSVINSLALVMKEEHADLLVIGAQGHGFIERITLGSVSLDQVVRRPYSVLVVRV